MKTAIFLFGAAILGAAFTPASAEEAHVAPVKDYIEGQVLPWLKNPTVVDAIVAQNAAHAGFSEADIIALDKKWRAGVDGGERTLIDGVLANAVSKFLQQKQAESGGTILEVFVMDNKGLNVGQSEVTSDYWQGDEAKFQKSFGAGKGAVFVDEVEKDESTQMLQSQVSVTISDGGGNPIGAVTVGVNLDKL